LVRVEVDGLGHSHGFVVVGIVIDCTDCRRRTGCWKDVVGGSFVQEAVDTGRQGMYGGRLMVEDEER
jgi:hypothetical protein